MRVPLSASVLFVALASLASADEPAKIRVDQQGDPLPRGVAARLGTTRLRPTESRFITALSPDGKHLVTGEWGAVRFWDLKTGQERRSFEAREAYRFFYLRFSPDGKRLAAVGDQQGSVSRGFVDSLAVWVWEVATGKLLFNVGQGEGIGVRGLAFLDSGKVLALHQPNANDRSDEGYPVTLWDLQTKRLTHRLGKTCRMAATPDGTVLATSEVTGHVTLWDASGNQLRSIKAHPGGCASVAFSPDSRQMVTTCLPSYSPLPQIEPKLDKKSLERGFRVWDVKTGRELRRFVDPTDTSYASFSPDGNTIMSGETCSMFWDVKSGELRGCLPYRDHTASSCCFHPDSQKVLWMKDATTLCESRIGSLSIERQWTVPRDFWHCLGVTRDGRVVFHGGSRLHILDLQSGKHVDVGEGHSAPIRSMEYSPDGRYLVSVDDRGSTRVWESKTGRLVFAVDKEEKPMLVSFSADSRRLILLDTDGILHLRELPSGKRVHETRVADADELRFSRGGWSALHPGDVHPSYVIRLLSNDRRLMLVAEGSRFLAAWDVATGKRLNRPGSLSPSAFLEKYYTAKLSPDGRFLVGASADDGLYLYEVQSGKRISSLPDRGRSVHFLAFSHDTKLLAWGAGEKIELWDLIQHKKQGELSGHRGGTTSIAFLADNTLASAGKDRTHRLWDVQAKREIARRERIPRWDGQQYDYSVLPIPGGRVLDVETEHSKGSYDTYYDACSSRAMDGRTSFSGVCFSPDGRLMARGDDLIDVLTGKLLGRLPSGHRGSISATTFSPDGRCLVTGSSDTTILVWDWAEALRIHEKQPATLDAQWRDLGHSDPLTAYRAMAALEKQPKESLPFLAEKLRPVNKQVAEPIRKLLADLDHRTFSVRKDAEKQLANTPAEWEPLLHQHLASGPSLEVRRRLEPLLQSSSLKEWSPDMLRALRSVQLLERLGGDDQARRILERLADGLPEVRLTQEARSTLRRWPRR